MVLEPRRVEEREIRRWPKMAWRLMRREPAAWVLLIVLGQLLPMLIVFNGLTIPVYILYHFVLIISGFVLMEKADCGDDWQTALQQLCQALGRYKQELASVIVMWAIFTCVLSVVGGSELVRGLLEGPFIYTKETAILHTTLALVVTPLMTCCCFMVQTHPIAGPLRIFYRDLVEKDSYALGEQCDRVNEDNLVGLTGKWRTLLALIPLAMMLPTSIFLWPFVVALSYIACREVFNPQVAQEQEERAFHGTPQAAPNS